MSHLPVLFASPGPHHLLLKLFPLEEEHTYFRFLLSPGLDLMGQTEAQLLALSKASSPQSWLR